MNFPTPDFSTPDLGLKSPGLKGLGLKLGVEKSGVEMSFNPANSLCTKVTIFVVKNLLMSFMGTQ